MSENIHERPALCTLEELESTTKAYLDYTHGILQAYLYPSDIPNSAYQVMKIMAQQVADARRGYYELLRLEYEHERQETSRTTS